MVAAELLGQQDRAAARRGAARQCRRRRSVRRDGRATSGSACSSAAATARPRSPRRSPRPGPPRPPPIRLDPARRGLWRARPPGATRPTPSAARCDPHATATTAQRRMDLVADARRRARPGRQLAGGARPRCRTPIGSRPSSRSCSTISAMPSSTGARIVAEAERLIREAHRLAPDNAAITDSLGWALFLQGRDPRGDRSCSSGPPRASRPTSRSTSISATPISPPAAGSRRASPGARRSVYAEGAAATRLRAKIETGLTPQLAAPLMQEIAYAKLNLALHVRAREADGYHRIETLFAFCEDGDLLTRRRGEGCRSRYRPLRRRPRRRARQSRAAGRPRARASTAPR